MHGRATPSATTPTSTSSKHPWRLDDEKLLYPFYERLVKWSKQYPDRPGLKNVCVHKGLFSPSVEKQFPHLVGYCNVADVGKAAKDWPRSQLHHLSLGLSLGRRRAAGGRPRRSGSAPDASSGRTTSPTFPAQYGVKNVYGDLGQIFAWTAAAEPRLASFIMGSLVKGLGADHVVWGTDSLWTGAPQWQIEALRRLEIPEDMQKKYGFAPLGAANGPVKNGIFGLNSAKTLQLLAEAAGGGADRPARALQGDLRPRGRRPHQPRLRVHQQGLAVFSSCHFEARHGGPFCSCSARSANGAERRAQKKAQTFGQGVRAIASG